MFRNDDVFSLTDKLHLQPNVFDIYLFLTFAGVSYGRFIAVRFGFGLSTYI